MLYIIFCRFLVRLFLYWFTDRPIECTSNLDKFAGCIIGANVCNVKADIVNMTCSVSYVGNIGPILKWSTNNITVSNGADSWSKVVRTDLPNAGTSSLLISAEYIQPNSQFICKIQFPTNVLYKEDMPAQKSTVPGQNKYNSRWMSEPITALNFGRSFSFNVLLLF